MEHLWAIVLAGGDGTRVAALTRRETGRFAPKQYCAFGREEPMVAWALRRANAIVPRERILAVVSQSHRPYWRRALSRLPAENVLVQPSNRGTAAGVLLPVLDVFLRRDRDASVLVFPADHEVAGEHVLRRSLLAAARSVRSPGSPLTLLGMTPEDEDPEFGWIVPDEGSGSSPRRVRAFVEKPDARSHRDLLQRGALVSSFLFAARGSTLLGLFEDALPGLLKCFLPVVLAGHSPEDLEDLYQRIPAHDFSRAVLERCVDSLRVLGVPPCGWSDLGTPERLERFLARRGRAPARREPGEAPPAAAWRSPASQV